MDAKMKKIFFYTVCITAAVSLFTLTGCQGEIFNSIREEVELESSTITGDIHSLVRFTESSTDYLFVENGDIYYKNASNSYHGAWTSDSNAPNDYTYMLASDSTYMYALGLTYTSDYTEGENVIDHKTLYYKSSVTGAWTAISGYESISSSTTVVLFGTNAPQASHRKAYVRIGSYVYSLNGSTLTALTTGTTSGISTPSTTCVSCVYFGSSTYFFNYTASTTNETADTAATYMYYVNGDNVYYSADGSTWTSYDFSCDDVYSIAYTSDYFVLGTSGGLQEAAHSSAGVPTGGADDDSFANASSTLSSSYKVNVVLAVTPANAMLNTDVYGTANYSGTASSTSAVFDNIGLWSYYPSRAKWNRE